MNRESVDNGVAHQTKAEYEHGAVRQWLVRNENQDRFQCLRSHVTHAKKLQIQSCHSTGPLMQNFLTCVGPMCAEHEERVLQIEIP